VQHWSDHAKGLFLAITGILILTPDALLIRLIETDQWSLLFWRGMFTFLTLALYITLTRRGNPVTHFRKLSRKEIVVATMFAINTILFVTSIRHTAVANTLVIISTAPVFAAVLSSLFLGEHAPLRTWITALIGVACITFIMGSDFGQINWVGDGAAVIVACTLGAILTLLRHDGKSEDDPAAIIGLGGLLTAGMVVFAAAPFSLQGLDWLFIFILGGFVIPVSFVLTSTAPKYLPAPEVGLIFLLETILGPIWVWLVVDEAPPELTVVGGSILIAALFVHTVLALRQVRA